MKMSKEMYEKFTNFYKMTVEKATDSEVKFILTTVFKAAEAKKMGKDAEFNIKNPLMSKENYDFIYNFFIDFLETANDNDAIYLIDALAACSKLACTHPDKVEKYVAERKAKKYGN